jgi:transposase
MPAKERQMGRRQFTAAFKNEACGLVTGSQYTPAKAAKELGVAEMTLRSWLKARGWRGPQQLSAPDQSDDPQVLKAHIRDLAKKLARAEMEREILKKATAFFAGQP